MRGVLSSLPKYTPKYTPKYDWDDIKFTLGAVFALLLIWLLDFWGIMHG